MSANGYGIIAVTGGAHCTSSCIFFPDGRKVMHMSPPCIGTGGLHMSPPCIGTGGLKNYIRGCLKYMRRKTKFDVLYMYMLMLVIEKNFLCSKKLIIFK